MGKTWIERRKPKTGRLQFKQTAEIEKVLWLIDRLARTRPQDPQHRPPETAQVER